jgi:diguanylate cyclase
VRHPRGWRLPRQIYLPRILGLGLAGLGIAAALRELTGPPWVWAILLIGSLVWPHVAYQWSSRSARPVGAEQRNLMIDAMLAGGMIYAVGANLVPSAAALAIICMNNMSVGGVRLGAWGLVAALAGALSIMPFLPLRVAPHSSLYVQLATFPVLAIYLPAFGWTTYRLARTLHRSREALRRVSQTDALSGLYNRRTFEVGFDATFEGLRERGAATDPPRETALVLCDVDHFKRINDTTGHAAGDAVIRCIGDSLRLHVPAPHVAARYGGDEFALLLMGQGPEEARAFVERLWVRLREEALAAGPVPAFTMSTGIACHDASLASAHEWMARADAALYEVKRRSRGGIHVAAVDGPVPVPRERRA